MSPPVLRFVLSAAYLLFPLAIGKCYQPSPIYAPPYLSRDNPVLSSALSDIERELSQELFPNIPEVDFKISVELTSVQQSLWSFHGSSPRGNNDTISGHLAEKESSNSALNEHSIYRMASITKVFTVYAVLIAVSRGLLDLDKPITHYIKELNSSKSTHFDRISLRSLGSQLSGIQRESAAMTTPWSLQNLIPNPVKQGYPPVDPSGLPSCGNPDKFFDCSRKEFLDELLTQRPAYAPNFKSTYSNIAFVLLGLALEQVTGNSYNEIIQEWVFDPLNMTDASLEKPDDSKGAIAGGNQSAWGVNLGFYNATGGMYSSTHSLSRFVRFVLGNPDLANGWLHPASFTTGGFSSYGMPWEILQSPRFLPDHGSRPVTFYTKSGNINGYTTNVMMLPEQGIGISLLTATTVPYVLSWVRDHVSSRLLPAIEDIALQQTATQYAGTYRSSHPLNSSMTLRVSRTQGLYISSWISNGTNFLQHFELVNQAIQPRPAPPGFFHTQLTPSLLREPLPVPRSPAADAGAEAGRPTGEMWRVEFAPHRDPDILLWDDFCLEDVQGFYYAGLEVNKIVFEAEDDGSGNDSAAAAKRPDGALGKARALHIAGLRVRLERVEDDPVVYGRTIRGESKDLGVGSEKIGVSRVKTVLASWYKWAAGSQRVLVQEGC